MGEDNHLYGLTREVIKKIQGAFAQFKAIDQVILYGSRATGACRTGSDIDLSLKTNGHETKQLLSEVIAAIDDLDLVYLFDISLFSEITNDNLIKHINRVGMVLYQRASFSAQ